MSLAGLCDKQIEVWPRVEARGTAGSPSFTWPAKTATLRARIQPATSRELTLAYQRGTQISHVIYTIVDPAVSEGDQFHFGTRVFDVVSAARNFDEQGRLWRTDVNETDQRQ